jgi:hypothetical protein
VLVQWVGLTMADVNWVPLDEVQKLYPDFKLKDELVQQGGRDVMVGLQYRQRGKQGSSAARNKGETPGMLA